MITLIEALNYRSLHHVSQPLRPYQVMFGENGSGIGTFLDVPILLADIVREGPAAALARRSPDPRDLLSKPQRETIELAVELRVPVELSFGGEFDTVRYEVAVSVPERGKPGLQSERVVVMRGSAAPEPKLKANFPSPAIMPQSILSHAGSRGIRTILHKLPHGNDYFYSENLNDDGRAWGTTFRFGPGRSALGNLPEEDGAFTVCKWLRDMLCHSVVSSTPGPTIWNGGWGDSASSLYFLAAAVGARLSEKRAERLLRSLRHPFPQLRAIEAVEVGDGIPRHARLLFRDSSVPEWRLNERERAFLRMALESALVGPNGLFIGRTEYLGLDSESTRALLEILRQGRTGQIAATVRREEDLRESPQDALLRVASTDEGETDVEPMIGLEITSSDIDNGHGERRPLFPIDSSEIIATEAEK